MIYRAIVFGAGTRGREIARLLSLYGVPTLLFDKGSRAEDAIRKIQVQHPNISKLQFASIEKDFPLTETGDLLIDCLPEDLEVKRELFNKLGENKKNHQIFLSTSTLFSIEELESILPEDFKNRFLKVHFSYPIMNYPGLEWVCSDKVGDFIRKRVLDFFWRILGRVPIMIKDGNGSISELIHVLFLKTACELIEKNELKIEEVDFLTGPLIGRPQSSTFREMDLGGLRHYSELIAKLKKIHKSDEGFWDIPLLEKVLKKKEKLHKERLGFYWQKKEGLFCYRVVEDDFSPFQPPQLEELKDIILTQSLQARLRALYKNKGKSFECTWDLLKNLFYYCSNILDEVCYTIHDFDELVKYKLGWKLGLFEIWDCLNFKDVADRLDSEHLPLPNWMEKWRKSGKESLYEYRDEKLLCVSIEGQEQEYPLGNISISKIERTKSVVEQGKHHALWDIGDGVFLFENRSFKGVITLPLLDALRQSIAKVLQEGLGIVIDRNEDDFSSGTDYLTLLHLVKEKKFDELEKYMNQIQHFMQVIKYSPLPLLSSLHGRTFSLGLTLAFHSHQIHGDRFTSMGWNEMGMGLLPMGGILKEMSMSLFGSNDDFQSSTQKALSLYNYLVKRITIEGMENLKALPFHQGMSTSNNPQLHLGEAKREVLRLYSSGFLPRTQGATVLLPGEQGAAYLYSQVLPFIQSSLMSDSEAGLCKNLADLMMAGHLSRPTPVGEKFLLERELETNLSLLGNPQTQKRMEQSLSMVMNTP